MKENFGIKWRSFRYVDDCEYHIIVLELSSSRDLFPSLDELRLWLHREIADDDGYVVTINEGHVIIAISHAHTNVAAIFKLMFLE